MIAAEHLPVSLEASDSSAVEYRSAPVHIFGPFGNGWRIRQPLPVTVELSDGRYLVSDDLFDVYGQGDSWDEAVEDYKVSLVEYFQIMADADDAPTLAVVSHLLVYVQPPRK